jgi:glycosyltransferase involved in cell wall biosynthesis
MRIAFDGTTLTPGRTGVGYYSEHLLHALADSIGDHELIVVSNRPVDTTRPLPPGTRVGISGGTSPRLVWMQTGAPRLLRRVKADVVHFTNGMVPIASPVPTVVTIHDMSLTLYPECHPHRRVWLNRPMVDLAARRATGIITVSESAKRDIVRYYGIDPERVHVVYEAAAPQFQRVEDSETLAALRQRYGLAARFVLYVGTIEPRKNLPTLLHAFARCRDRYRLEHQLVFAGPYGWLSRDLEELIARLKLRDAIRLTGYIPFAELPALYSGAEMFVFPSIYEGFGLPVVEAMACGTPVVTGRADALVEIAGGAAEHVDPRDADALAAMLARLADDPQRRAELSALGVQRARSFSWSRAASETLTVYRHVLLGAVTSPATAHVASSRVSS